MTRNQLRSLKEKFFAVWRGNVADFFGDVLCTSERHARCGPLLEGCEREREAEGRMEA